MSLSASQDRVRAWLFDRALPLWAEAGVAADGGFHEALDFDGKPVPGLPRRTRVQARQIYAFAQGAALGWAPGRAVAQAGLDRMIAACRRDDGLWRLTTDSDGTPMDDGVDLYDQAFVLFALAAAHRVLADGRAAPLAARTVQSIRERMTSPHGGWDEAIPPSLPRRQNPHMHLLEAMLAWRGIAPAPAWDAMAAECLALFDRAFLDGANGVLGEYFTGDWRVAPGEPGRVAEPGHHMEWVWLLDRARAAGMGDRDAAARTLYATAVERGLDAGGFAIREFARDGGVIDGGRRLWAQTEAIRTHLLVGDAARAAALTEGVFDSHLATAVPGLWMDSYDAAGKPMDARVPASTLYHLMTAFTAVLEHGS